MNSFGHDDIGDKSRQHNILIREGNTKHRDKESSASSSKKVDFSNP
jgi:hypothetical protein